MTTHHDFTPDHSHVLRPTKRGLVLYCNNKRVGLLAWSDLEFMREKKMNWQVLSIPLRGARAVAESLQPLIVTVPV